MTFISKVKALEQLATSVSEMAGSDANRAMAELLVALRESYLHELVVAAMDRIQPLQSQIRQIDALLLVVNGKSISPTI